jgi:hypothetical protein
MYTNIPDLEVINIIMENDPETKKADQEEIISVLKSMMEQNYFQFNQQTEALAMGAPISAVLAEVYIQ